MAWVTEYDLRWVGKNNAGDILIQRDGGSYVGPLTLRRDSLQVKSFIGNWESYIVRNQCRFTIVNEGDTVLTWQDLLPLMTISQGQYRVVVDQDEDTPSPAVNLFTGFLNCETVSQDMTYFSDITFTASGLVDKLKHIEPSGITDPSVRISLIDIIDHCLRLTGGEYNIRVLCNYEPARRGYSPGYTIFCRTGLQTELFWRDNIQRNSALEVLETILSPLNCYLYWHKGYWYIDNYEQLRDGTRNYVEYTTGTSYYHGGPGGTPVVEYVSDLDLWSLYHVQVGGTQKLSIAPGLKQLNIKLDQLQHFNLLYPDLSDVILSSNPNTLKLRQWHARQSASFPSWTAAGKPYKNITNAIRRGGYSILSDDLYYNGLTTEFMATVEPDAVLTIKFSFGLESINQDYNGPADANREKMWFRFHWWLRIEDYGTPYYRYLKKEPDSSDDAWSWQSTNPGNYIDVSYASFDPEMNTYQDLEIRCPIGDGDLFDFLPEDEIASYRFNFRAGTEMFYTDDNDLFYPKWDGNKPAAYVYYGDFHAAISGEPEDNLIEGEVNSNFLEKKTINLKMFDTPTWNYRNMLLTDSFGTEVYINPILLTWDNGKGAYGPLADKLMESKFRLYNKARQKIRMDRYIANDAWNASFRPLQIWTDSKQPDKAFATVEDTHFPDRDLHSIALFEYDDSEDVTLIG